MYLFERVHRQETLLLVVLDLLDDNRQESLLRSNRDISYIPNHELLFYHKLTEGRDIPTAKAAALRTSSDSALKNPSALSNTSGWFDMSLHKHIS